MLPWKMLLHHYQSIHGLRLCAKLLSRGTFVGSPQHHKMVAVMKHWHNLYYSKVSKNRYWVLINKLQVERLKQTNKQTEKGLIVGIWQNNKIAKLSFFSMLLKTAKCLPLQKNVLFIWNAVEVTEACFSCQRGWISPGLAGFWNVEVAT